MIAYFTRRFWRYSPKKNSRAPGARCLWNPEPPVYPCGELPILAIHTFFTGYSCVGKIPRDTLRYLENPRQPTALEVSSYLLALWLNPYVQVFFIDIPCPCHTDVMEIIMCENVHNHPLIPMKSFFWLRRHSGHKLDLGISNLH